MSKIFLITTALDETWDFKKNTLMLGNWCNSFDKREKILKLKNNSILEYHWNDAKKVEKDYLYLNNFGEKILSELSEKLNYTHSVNFSQNYWRIVLSNWLFSSIHVIFDKWEILKKAFREHSIESTILINISHDEMIPQSIENFTDITFQDKWNHYIFSEIIKHQYKGEINYKTIDLKKDTYVSFYEKSYTFKNTIFYNIYDLFRKLYLNFFSDEKFFITDTYLGKFGEIILNLKLKNFPITISPKTYYFIKPNISFRKNFHLEYKVENDFELFFKCIIPFLLPCTFLENYKKVLIDVEKKTYPKNPKVIFTSHAINKKTLTSFYIAEKKELGAKLINGQHGGVYGQCKFHWYEDFEKKISDKFVTWGWSNDNKTIPIGILKPRKKLQRKKFGKLCLIMRPKERYFSTILDSRFKGPQMLEYHEECMKMVEILKNDIKNNYIYLRLHPRTYGWHEQKMWENRFSSIEIDKGFSPINKTINASRLAIYTYNSTGYLEFFDSNFPTLLFWSKKDNIMNSETDEFFEELKKVKIFHDNKESLSEHINQIWENVDEWWLSKNVQNIKDKFCNKYVKVNNNKINDLKSLIIKTGTG